MIMRKYLVVNQLDGNSPGFLIETDPAWFDPYIGYIDPSFDRSFDCWYNLKNRWLIVGTFVSYLSQFAGTRGL